MWKNKLENKKESGFTLLEILIAISILMIGILGVASMQASSIHGNATANSVTEGINSGSAKIEELLETGMLSYGDADLTDSNADGVAGLNNATAATADRNEVFGRYTVYWNVAADEFIPRTKTIRVIVTWNDHAVLKSTAFSYVISEII